MPTDSTRARSDIRAMINKVLVYVQCTRHETKLTNPQHVPLWESIYGDLREAELACLRLRVYFEDAANGLDTHARALEDVADVEYCPSCGCPECDNPECTQESCPRCDGEFCDFHGTDPCECAADERHQLTRGDND